MGRSVSVAEAPRRIVSLAPNITEILFALGLGGEVAGVTAFCDWPPPARGKPKVGGFINPSLEAIVALEPDLVLATADGNREEDVRRLDSIGIRVFVVDTRSLEDIAEAILAIGRVSGRPERAVEIVESMDARRNRVRSALQGRPLLSVFVALDRNPLVTAGQGTFVDELLTLAGGRNVVDFPGGRYPVFSFEQLLVSDPEVIVAATGPGAVSKEESLAHWRQLPGGSSLRAVRSGRVFEVGMADFFRPGPRIIDSLERLAAMLHPGAVTP